MKLNQKLVIIISLLLVYFNSFSQNSIGIFSSINYGNLESKSDLQNFNSDFGKGFGIMFRKDTKSKVDFILQLGIESIEWISKDFEMYDPAIDLYWKGSSLSFGFGGNLNFIENQNFKIGLTLLPKVGYVYNQEFKIVEDRSIGITEFYTNISVLLGFESKVNVQYNLSSHLVLHIRPGISMISYFDNNEYLQRRLYGDIGLSYVFKSSADL